MQKLLWAALVGAAMIVCPVDAQAGKGGGLLFINWGEDVFETGELPDELAEGADAAGWKAGYKCSIFGLLWAYFHWWDCVPVAFQGTTYDDSDYVQAAVKNKYSESDMKMNLWMKHGRWLFLILIALGIYGAVSGNDEDEEAFE